MSSTTAPVLRPGDSRRYEAGPVIIAITRAHLGHYNVTVEHASTGVIVDQLTSGPWPTEEAATEAARRAYRAFAGGRSVVEVLDLIDRPNSLAELAAVGTRRQVRPTMAGAHLAKLTPAGQRALNAHRNGVVYPGEGISRATLHALARQGYGELTFEGRRRRIASIVLNKRGMAAVKAVA